MLVIGRWRRKGDKVLKSKYVLLTVALFCVTDCALVLGELILDLHKVKGQSEYLLALVHIRSESEVADCLLSRTTRERVSGKLTCIRERTDTNKNK